MKHEVMKRMEIWQRFYSDDINRHERTSLPLGNWNYEERGVPNVAWRHQRGWWDVVS